MEETKSLHPLLCEKTPEQLCSEMKENFSLLKPNITTSITQTNKEQWSNFYYWKNIFAYVEEANEFKIGEWKERDVLIENKDDTDKFSILTNWIMKKDLHHDNQVRTFIKNRMQLDCLREQKYCDVYKNLLIDVIKYGSSALFVSLFVHLYETENVTGHKIFEDNVDEFTTIACLYQNAGVFYITSSFNERRAYTVKNILLTFVLPSQSTEISEYIVDRILKQAMSSYVRSDFFRTLKSCVSLCCYNKCWKKLTYIKDVLTKSSEWKFSETEIKTVLFSTFPDRKSQVWICVALDLSSPST